MEPTIKCGKHLAEHANLTGSRFHNVNLTEAEFDDVNMSKTNFHNVNLTEVEFDDVNMSKTKFHNINLSDVTVTAAQMGGAKFKHIGPPPDKNGQQERQRPVTFEEMMLCDSHFHNVDLSNVRITDCNVTGMTIDGVLVTELIAAYEKFRKR